MASIEGHATVDGDCDDQNADVYPDGGNRDGINNVMALPAMQLADLVSRYGWGRLWLEESVV